MSEEPRMLKRADNVREMSISDLVSYCIQRGLDPDKVVLTAAYLKWESEETDEERLRRLAWAEEHDKRTEKWERETYARLRTKFGDSIEDGYDPERMKALARMLLDSGDITPMGVRLINKVVEDSDE